MWNKSISYIYIFEICIHDNGDYLLEINIILEIDLINGFFLVYVKFQRLF